MSGAGCEKLPLRCADMPPDKVGIQGIPKGADAQWSDGLDRSSDEVPIIGMERRVQLIGLH